MPSQPSNSMNLNSTTSGLVNWDGSSIMDSTALIQYSTLTADSSNTIHNVSPGNIGQILTSNGPSAPPTYQDAAVGTDLHVARYIVSAGGSADGANYTDIPTAYADAVSAAAPQTVFIQPGTYTLSSPLSLVAGINLSALSGDAFSPSVSIVGQLIADYPGSATIAGIRFVTNGDFSIVNSGSNASKLFLKDCYLYLFDHISMSFTNTGGSFIQLSDCFGSSNDISLTYFTATSTFNGAIRLINDFLDGPSTGISTLAGGGIEIHHTEFRSLFTASNASTVGIDASNITGAVVLNNTGVNQIEKSSIVSSATALTIGDTVSVTTTDMTIFSNATNAIAGTGTLNTTPISFTGSSSTIEGTLTVNSLPFLPSSGGGGVTGPGSSTDNAVATWNGTGGTALNSPPSPLVSSAGIQTNPNQPAFLAYLTIATGNVTGDGTDVIIPFNTVSFDQGSNFNTSSNYYVCPVTGLYQYNINCTLFTASPGTNTYYTLAFIVNGSTTYNVITGNLYTAAAGTTQQSASGSILINNTAGDQVSVKVAVNGNASKNIQVNGGASITTLSGFLVA